MWNLISQAAFTMTYSTAPADDYSLHYDRPVEPTLSADDMQWAQGLFGALR